MRGIFAERVAEGGRRLRRDWPIAADERVVLVDDILTTGLSLLETVEAVRAAGIGAARGGGHGGPLDRPVAGTPPLHALGRIEIPSWEASDCPLCAGGSVPTKPGSR